MKELKENMWRWKGGRPDKGDKKEKKCKREKIEDNIKRLDCIIDRLKQANY